MNTKNIHTKKFEHLYRYCTKDLENWCDAKAETAIPIVTPSLIIAVKNIPGIIKNKEELNPFANFFNVFKKYFGKQITYHYKGKGGKFTKPENLNWINEQIENAKQRELKKKKLIGYTVEAWYDCSASKLPHGIAQPPAFHGQIDLRLEYQRVIMEMALPVDLVETNSSTYFSTLLHDLFNDYPIEMGYIGFSLLAESGGLINYDEIDWRELYLKNKCFLPFDLFDIPFTAGWITLLGDQHLQKLGGRLAAKKFFANEKAIIIHEFKYGIGIQIGKQPIAGTQDEDLSLYKKLTQFILPIRNQTRPYINFGISQKEYDIKKKEWIETYPNKGKDEKWKADNDKWYKRFDD